MLFLRLHTTCAAGARTAASELARCLSAARGVVSSGIVVSALFFATPASANQKVHVVASGQRLGSIAKRYGVTIEELCQANGIRRRDPIRPGQKLIVPGEKNRVATPASTGAKQTTTTNATRSTPSAPARSTSKSQPAAPRVHVVSQGQTLGGIARRYGVGIDALCRASGITRQSKLRIGQRLTVPHPTDRDGEQARAFRLNGGAPSGGRADARSYARAPAQRGYLNIVRYDRSWKGQVTGPRTGKLLPKARATLSALLGASSSGTQIDERLIYLLVKVSDHFGGRPVRIVSGLRDNSYFHDSKHPRGRALDFSIIGVPNEVVRDYCRTLGNVGVGYYPNSSFVHLDVRDRPTYWVDYAGPGEPPRSTPWAVAKRPPAAPAPTTQVAAGDEGAEKTVPPTVTEAGALVPDSVSAATTTATPAAAGPRKVVSETSEGATAAASTPRASASAAKSENADAAGAVNAVNPEGPAPRKPAPTTDSSAPRKPAPPAAAE